MDPRTNNRRSSTASDADSLVLYLNGGPPPKKDGRQNKRRRRRACPVLAFFGLVIHFLSAGCGVALSVIIVRFGLQVTSAGTQDLVARILVFVASCMGIFYVLMHACAAREKYVRSHVGAQFFGFFTVAVAIIIMRLAAPVWIAAVVMTALVAAQKGFALNEGVQGNVIWIQLGIAGLGLLSIFLMLVITERTDRPFATSLFSKKTFIMGLDGDPNRTDTFDMSVSRAGFRNDLEKKRTTATNSLLTKELTRDTQDDTRNSMFDRTLIVTPTSQERDEDDLPNPTVPALPAMPEWRQKRDTALRNTLRVEDNRSLAVPSPLTAVYGAAPSPNSLTKYGSQFSWRPPTRDSMISARNTRDLEEEYRNNWPPAEMLQQAKSPNRASMPAPSQPPTVPLPPLVPRSEVTDSAAPTNLVEGAKEPDSQRSSETVSILMEITSTKIPETQPTSITDEVATSMAAEERQPAEEAPRPRGRRPALPSLEKLSARAAARHKRVPTLDPDVNQAPSTNTASDEATKTESSRSSPESLEPRRTEVKSRSNQSEDIDDSGFESEDDTGPEEPRRSRRSLLRSNTAGPRLVRNFSRPRIPSSMLNRRRPSKGNLPPAAFKTGGGEGQSSSSGSRRDNDSGGSSFTGIKQQFRRSRSLPAVRDRKADTTAAATEVDTERKTIVEVNPEFKVTVPILQPAPVRNTSRAREAQQKKAPPRFSPFPSAATSMAPEKKVKGLGQGSQRRLGQRVNQWRDGVDTTQDALAAQQAEIDAQQRQLLEDFDLMGRTSIVEGGRRPSIDSRRLSTDGRRPSMENRGRQPARPDVLGLPAKPHPVSKLSRDKSMNGRGRHVAQNF